MNIANGQKEFTGYVENGIKTYTGDVLLYCGINLLVEKYNDKYGFWFSDSLYFLQLDSVFNSNSLKCLGNIFDNPELAKTVRMPTEEVLEARKYWTEYKINSKEKIKNES